MSQEDLSAACGMHSTEIGRLERGVREPRLSTIVRLARGLKVAPADLLEGIR
jgi:transcriptional regulator with XRE-family HTH domain